MCSALSSRPFLIGDVSTAWPVAASCLEIWLRRAVNSESVPPSSSKSSSRVTFSKSALLLVAIGLRESAERICWSIALSAIASWLPRNLESMDAVGILNLSSSWPTRAREFLRAISDSTSNSFANSPDSRRDCASLRLERANELNTALIVSIIESRKPMPALRMAR